jgi:hypothetical protein
MDKVMKLFGPSRLDSLQQGLDSQAHALKEIADKIDTQAALVSQKFAAVAELLSAYPSAKALLGEQISDGSPADYAEKLLRASGRIFNRDKPSSNPGFVELLKHASGDEVADSTWHRLLAEAQVEASAVPGAAQVFERQSYVEDYVSELARKHRARYLPGWVDADDALFLYWLVRQIKPRRIVQCGAFNGRSSAYMMLALAKNGPEGTLSVIDNPPVFDPGNPEWTTAGKIYNAVVPAGRTSAWMVPDQYRNRLKVWNGDAKSLLPQLVEALEEVDLFYYAADHTYQEMTSAFKEAKRKLGRGGIIVAVDAGWNASLWDFAESFGAPSYTFKGTIGVGFF